jgi:hypothetical protein
MTDLDHAIRLYITKAIELLGAAPAQLAALDGAGKDALYAAAEHLGADCFLPATIGSWGDTREDEEVLEDLRQWTAGEAQEQVARGGAA